MTENNILSDNLDEVSDINVYGMFMTPVGVYHNRKHQQQKQQLLDFIATLSPDDVKESSRKNINSGVMQLGGNNILNDERLIDIKLEVINAVKSINEQSLCYDLGEEINITDSIIELHNEGAIYAPHENSNCLYSGTYFVNFNINEHSPLKFKRTISSPHYPILQVKCNKLTPFNMLDGPVPITEGDITLYPSNLSRGYEESLKGNKILITFNVAL